MSGAFEGRTVLISGAGRGLGEATALHLASLGAIVAVCDRDKAPTDEVVEAIRAAGGRAHGYVADLSSRERFHDVARRFAETAGPLDVVVNNASVLIYEPIEEISEETLDRVIAGGLKTVFWGTQALLANRDSAREANIINYSSPVVYRGFPNTAAYSAVKGAVASLTKVLAAELGPKNVRVNALAPGSIPTPGGMAYVSADEYAKRSAAIPMRRLGEAVEIARAVAFLLGPDASFINGAMLSVDGGIIAA